MQGRRRPNKQLVWFSLIAFCGCPWTLFAQPPAREKQIRAIQVSEAPQLDGFLDEELWRLAGAAADFRQRDPSQGQPASEETQVKIVYHDQGLFLGVRCYDSRPDQIIATERARDDTLNGDDTFEVILDTFHNHQDGFLFRTNPLGAKFDSWITDEGRRENPDWDEKWIVAAHQDEEGWTAEIHIPFKSLRMPADKDQVWGVDFRRQIRHKNEEAIWSNYSRDFDFTMVSRAGHLVGLTDLTNGLKLRVKPYATAGLARFARGDDGAIDHLFDAGLEDAKFRLTPSLTLDVTAHPDFAQVEVDQQVSNLSRFPIFFPEKREFFQENASLFDFGPGGPLPELKLFHSRRIGLSQEREQIDIIAGVKLTGRLEGFDIGVLNIQTESFAQAPGNNFSVARIKKKILSRSVIGALFTNRQSTQNGDYNRTFGFDSNFVLFDNLNVGSFFAASETPGLEGNEWALRPARFLWETDLLVGEAEHTIIRRNFNAEIGFVPRKDMAKSKLNFQIKPRPNIEWIRQLIFGAGLVYTTNDDRVLETRQQDISFTASFENGDRFVLGYTRNFESLQDPFVLRGEIPVAQGAYASDNYRTRYIPYQGHRISGFFDFQHENGFWGGRRSSVDINPRIRWSENMSFDIEYGLDWVELPHGSFTSKVANFRTNYNFSNSWLTSTTLQYDNIEDLLNFQFRLDYIYRPGDDLFLVFNQTHRSGETDLAIILKLTHSFEF